MLAESPVVSVVTSGLPIASIQNATDNHCETHIATHWHQHQPTQFSKKNHVWKCFTMIFAFWSRVRSAAKGLQYAAHSADVSCREPLMHKPESFVNHILKEKWLHEYRWILCKIPGNISMHSPNFHKINADNFKWVVNYIFRRPLYKTNKLHLCMGKVAHRCVFIGDTVESQSWWLLAGNSSVELLNCDSVGAILVRGLHLHYYSQ